MNTSNEGSNMGKERKREQTVQVAVRLSDELNERLEAYAKHLDDERPGVTHTKADAIRVLLIAALDVAETKRGRR